MSSLGLTPADVNVKVYGLDGFGAGDGVEGLPPHDATTRQSRSARRITCRHYPRGPGQIATGAPQSHRADRLTNDDAPFEPRAVGIVVIVIAAGSRARKAERGFRLPRLKQSDVGD